MTGRLVAGIVRAFPETALRTKNDESDRLARMAAVSGFAATKVERCGAEAMVLRRIAAVVPEREDRAAAQQTLWIVREIAARYRGRVKRVQPSGGYNRAMSCVMSCTTNRVMHRAGTSASVPRAARVRLARFPADHAARCRAAVLRGADRR